MHYSLRNSQRVTIKDVARVAGISAQTVSRVINDRPDVAEDTRQRVQQIIEDLGYQPSALARSLIQQRSFTLGVVIAGLKYIGPSRTLNGITQRAEELGYSLLLKELPSFTAVEYQSLIQSLLARHVDGIIWATSEVGDNQSWVSAGMPDIPVPTIFLTTHSRPEVFSVSYDNYLGGRKAVQHLVDQGYRHIGHISGPLDWWEARQRKAGWDDVLKEANMPPGVTHSWEGNWSSASGEQAFRQLVETFPEIEAVFVGNDQMALGVLQLATRIGKRIPQELGVVGFDGIPETRYYWPPLTTVFQDQNRLGFTAVEKIVEIIERIREKGEANDPETIILQPELIIRDSSIKKK
jgi:DNA-binding LacI/PurR family transcriptional regulator